MQTVIVTGSQGFIGGYIVSELLRQNYQVIGIDNFSKYGRVEKAHDDHPNFTLIEEDLAHSNQKLIGVLYQADHLIAGAAKIGGISYFHTYAYDLLASNERIMANTCDAAIEAFKKNQNLKITYISSSMVFENATHWPSKEGDQLQIPPPSSSYGFQKLSVEYFAKAVWDQYRIPYTIVRVFNCVGIGEARAVGTKPMLSGEIELAMSHVLPDLVQKVLKGQNPLRILGSGDQIRHLTYGGDLAKGIVLTLNNPIAYNDDFNISTSEPINILNLAKKVWTYIYGSEKDFKYISDEPYIHDVQKRIPDTSKAKQLLGFSAQTTIEEVLDEVVPWIKDAMSKGLI